LAFDPESQYLGNVYAKALLGATENAGLTDQVLEQLDSFVQDVVAKVPKLEAVLSSPRVSHEEKVAMLDKAVGRTMHPVLLNFLKVVSRHGRLHCLRAIARGAREQLNALRGRLEVTVESAAPLSDALPAAAGQSGRAGRTCRARR
jgi:F-type H+-transporting ATPase subunit delta